MNRRRKVFVGVLAAVLVGLAAFGLSIYSAFTYKHFMSALPSPDGKSWFALFGDSAGFGDLSWHVYELPQGVEPDAVDIRSGFGLGALFENYSEAGNHTSDPKLQVIGGRYLVFSRGGLYHSLYDILTHQVLINIESPWNAFLDSDYYRQLPGEPNFSEQAPHIERWKRATLHDPIEEAIQMNLPPTAAEQGVEPDVE